MCKKQTVRPVTVRQILTATRLHSQAPFVIDNEEIIVVRLVAHVRYCQVAQGTRTRTFYLSDGSMRDAKVSATQFRRGDGNECDDEIPDDYNAYVCVVATMSEWQGKNKLTIIDIRPMTDPHEFWFHTLEVIYVHKWLTNGPRLNNLINADRPQSREDSPMDEDEPNVTHREELPASPSPSPMMSPRANARMSPIRDSRDPDRSRSREGSPMDEDEPNIPRGEEPPASPSPSPSLSPRASPMVQARTSARGDSLEPDEETDTPDILLGERDPSDAGDRIGDMDGHDSDSDQSSCCSRCAHNHRRRRESDDGRSHGRSRCSHNHDRSSVMNDADGSGSAHEFDGVRPSARKDKGKARAATPSNCGQDDEDMELDTAEAEYDSDGLIQEFAAYLGQSRAGFVKDANGASSSRLPPLDTSVLGMTSISQRNNHSAITSPTSPQTSPTRDRNEPVSPESPNTIRSTVRHRECVGRDPLSNLSNTQRTILLSFYNNRDVDPAVGMTVKSIWAGMPRVGGGVCEREFLQEFGYLVDQDYIYYTFDDDHFHINVNKRSMD